MKDGKAIFLAFALMLPAAAAPAQKPTRAQKSTTKKHQVQRTPEKKAAAVDSASTAAGRERKVRDMVAFLEYMLNTLGSATTSSRDKDVLLTQSYSKIFKDDHVQIEDDLDPDRQIITNKSVVAYLKDVDFFFSDVKFKFTIDGIKSGENAEHQLFYIVSLERTLRGTTADGKEISNTCPRYIEINYNSDQQDLRIASVYTHDPNPKEALMNWWKQLSLEWQTVFRTKLRTPGKFPGDSLSYDDVRAIISFDSLNVGGNPLLQNIGPLAQLGGLKVLNISNTAIADLSPVRYLSELTSLDVSGSKVQDLAGLAYADKLIRLSIRSTTVSDASVVGRMPRLHYLDAAYTRIADITAVASLTELVELRINHSRIHDLSALQGLTGLRILNAADNTILDVGPLRDLKNLETLNIDSTRVGDLTPLSGLDHLSIVSMNGTPVSDLRPLHTLTRLEKVYCDGTRLTSADVDAFAAENTRVLVVFDSDELGAWWNKLSETWKDVLANAAHISRVPTKDELAKIPAIDSVNVANKDISDLVALRPLRKLRVLIAPHTFIRDLLPLRDDMELRYIDISETDVSDLAVTAHFPKLRVLRADKSKVESLAPLFDAPQLKRVYVDQTAILDIAAQEFLEHNAKCLLVYKTIHLNRWWRKLPTNWKEVFRSHLHGDTTSSRENLHELVERETFHFNDVQVADLSPFSEFVRLKELWFSGTAVIDLTPLKTFKSLRSLHATDSPLQQVASLADLTGLEDLDLSGSPVDELKWIADLQRLKKFNCSGTQVRKLDPLRALDALEYLDCSNTRVTNPEPASHFSLKTLKCYNTRISAREIAAFRRINPQCNVIYYR